LINTSKINTEVVGSLIRDINNNPASVLTSNSLSTSSQQTLGSIELPGEDRDAINMWTRTQGSKVGNEDNCAINYSCAYCHESQSGCVDDRRFTNAESIAINALSTTFKIVYVRWPFWKYKLLRNATICINYATINFVRGRSFSLISSYRKFEDRRKL